MKQIAFLNSDSVLSAQCSAGIVFKNGPRSSATMLVIFALFFLNLSGLYAQYTPVAYNFPNSPTLSGVGTYDGVNDDQNLYQMTDLAANGYGQWSVSDQYSTWMLSGDTIADANGTGSSATKPIPSGVIAFGPIPGSTPYGYSRVVTNLRGSVRYVVLGTRSPFASTPSSFAISGLDAKNIGISMAGLPLASSRCVIKTASPLSPHDPYERALISFPSTSTQNINSNGLDVPTTAGMGDDRDVWDVAMDSKFLYIAWETQDSSSPTSVLWNIYVTAVDLSTGYEVSGWPKLVLAGAHGPSIACDARNSPSAPTFDVSGISAFVNGEIHEAWYFDSAVQPYLSFQPTIQYPSSCLSYPNNSQTFGYEIERVKLLVSSVYNPNETIPHPTAKAFYILRHAQYYNSGLSVWEDYPYVNMTTCELLFQRFHNSTSDSHFPASNVLDNNANYVDGPLMSTHLAAAVPTPLSDADYCLVDEPFVVLSNPYDAQNSTVSGSVDLFSEFHALYRLSVKPNYDYVFPVTIVRADQNGCWGSTETRTVINRKWSGGTWVLADGLAYGGVAAVNQMGIHVHYQDEYGVNYSRDKRRFDEFIDENTLATYDCPVGDGTSHGGTPGATLAGGDTLCVWTDPFIGVTNAPPNDGLYTPNHDQPLIWQNGRLRFVDPNISLNIGSLSEGALPGHLIMMPNAVMEFNNTGQTLQVNSSSTFDYYGLPNQDLAYGTSHFTNFIGLGGTQTFGINLAGGGFAYCPDETSNDAPCSLISPATLTVHGGAVFELGSLCAFNASNAVINSNFETSLYPAFTTSTNPSTSGILKFDGTASLADCYVYSDVPSGSIPLNSNYFVQIRPCQSTASTYCSTPITSQFTATNCLFQNNATSPGNATVEETGNLPGVISVGDVLIDGGRCEATQLFFDSPYLPVTVENAYFDKIQSTGVYLYQYLYPSSYGTMSITGNTFETFASGTYGIRIQNFGQTSFMSTIQAEYNDFSTATSDGSTQAAAAIYSEGSCAVIMGNYITGAGYNRGILNEGLGAGGVKTNSLICRNTVENAYNGGNGPGLVTDHWNGISKLNEFMYNDIGHQSGANDIGSVLFSRYGYNRGAGLQTTTSSTIVHMDGGHAGSDDYGAFDTLDHNGTATITTHAEIESAGSTLILGETGTGTGTTYGRNNFISANSPNGLFLLNTSGTTDLSAGVAENFWATDYSGLWSLTTITLSGTTNSHIDNGSTSYPSSLACDGSINIPGYSVYCGIGFDVRTEKGKNSFLPLSNMLDNCVALFKAADNLLQQQKYSESYDTSKLYIENCANVDHSYNGFNITGASVQFISNDNMRWLDYREWLKSVLYLDTTSEAQTFYCSDADEIVGTFAYRTPTGTDFNGAVAVIDYLMKSGKCLMDSTSLLEARNNFRESQVINYDDTVRFPDQTPLDTSEPNIDDLGLGILRGKPSTVSMEPLRSKHNILSFGATESPFRDETQLYFELSQPVALRIDLLDVLGREVGHPSTGQLFAPGMHYAAIFGNDLSAGTLYARLTAANGEVRTLKLVKMR